MSRNLKKFGPPEKVYVENEWYDGPRFGVCDIGGKPHRFKSLFDEDGDEYLGRFLVCPIDKTSLDLEVEQWCIFVEWNYLYESGKVGTDTHPGHGGISQRWDEIEALLELSRSEIPSSAKKAIAELVNTEETHRYGKGGPSYKMRWCFL